METTFQKAIAGESFRRYEHWPSRRIEARCERVSEVENVRLIAIGQLTACVAHDLKNFCNQAKGLHYVIMRRLGEGACESVRSHMSLLENAINNIITLSENILNFGQGKKKQLVLQKPVAEYIEELVETVGFSCSGVTLSVHPSMKNVVVDMSKFELQQILLNLIQNASYAVDDKMSGDIEKSISIIVHPLRRSSDFTLLNNTPDKEFVGVSVCDNGRGMDEVVLAQVATPFFTTKASNGNGLGLFMSTQISNLYGGTIVIHTRENEGTQVTLCLPCSTP